MYISVFLNFIKKRKQKRGSKALRASFMFHVWQRRAKGSRILINPLNP